MRFNLSPLMPARRRPPKSKYTSDRNTPGAFEGETITRRRFMTGVTHGAGGIAAAAFTLPALGFAVGPIFSREPFQWQTIGVPSDFPKGTYMTRVVEIVEGIGEAGKTTAFVRQGSAKFNESPSSYVAISTRCAHLGCPVNYVAAAKSFVCPCHGGVYDFQGKVIGGPPVRPLDRFQTRVEKGQVQIGPRYSVTSQLQPVRARDPGEYTGGVWNYIYPPRPDTAPAP
jgi:Rieske Fe-S protein